MILKATVLKIVDNCGARKAKCIHLLNKKSCSKIGDLIFVVLRKFFNLKKKVKKKIIYLGAIIGVKYWNYRHTGYIYKMYDNRVLIFNMQFKFLGSRIYGIVTREFKKKVYRFRGIRFYYKLLSYSSLVI